MTYLCYFLVSFLIIRLVIAFTNYLSSSYLPKKIKLEYEPKVSILIPARNEEKNIGKLLEQLSKVEYGQFEIIVYNDQSTDKTEDILND